MGLKKFIRKSLRMRDEVGFGFYAADFLFRRILRQNSGVTWAIHHTTTIHEPHKIVRGKNCYPGDSPNIYMNARNGIILGDYTNIGPGAGFMSANHDFIDNALHIPGPPIVIGKFCWIAKDVNIMPGVNLGDFTVVGAGAIVTKSFPEGHCVIAGNPARKIRELNVQECENFAKQKA